MKNKLFRTIGILALVILLMVTLGQISVSAQDKENEEESSIQTQENSSSRRRNARALEGVWNLLVTGRNCETGEIIRTGPAILTFARGGTMHDFGSGRPPSIRSAGYGVWSYHSNGQYTDAFQFFIYNADGTLAGRQIIREQITLSPDGNSLTNTGASQILDVNGNVTSIRCSTATGTRFE